MTSTRNELDQNLINKESQSECSHMFHHMALQRKQKHVRRGLGSISGERERRTVQLHPDEPVGMTRKVMKSDACRSLHKSITYIKLNRNIPCAKSNSVSLKVFQLRPCRTVIVRSVTLRTSYVSPRDPDNAEGRLYQMKMSSKQNAQRDRIVHPRSAPCTNFEIWSNTGRSAQRRHTVAIEKNAALSSRS